jgi:4-amino-4-deoxychorismate lyase
MCQLFESVKVQDGRLFNIGYHNYRINTARKQLYNLTDKIHLEEFLEVPDNAAIGLFKCRVIYNRTIIKIEFEKYVWRNVEKIKVVEDDLLEYSYKFVERKRIDDLLKKNTSSDKEEILVVKNGLLTDTSRANVVLFNGKEWHTPANPLLKGTQRQKLLDEKRIIEKEILLKDLKHYKEIKLINAMMEFETTPTLPVEAVDY